MPACLLSAFGKTSAGFCRSSNPLSYAKRVTAPQTPAAQRGQSVKTMALAYPEPIVMKPTSGTHTSTVIMLHGLGDTGTGWADVGSMFQPILRDTKFIFPTAPRRRITVNGGMAMTGWFDIASLEDINQAEDTDGFKESKRYIEELLAKEGAAGVPSSRVVIAGFSQGGAVALLMLRSEKKLAGVVGLSTWLPLRNESVVVSAANKDTPVFMGHGNADPVVQYEFGVASYRKLESVGAKVEMETYSGMGHSACQTELNHIGEFLKKALA